jgi:hypothetical protein
MIDTQVPTSSDVKPAPLPSWAEATRAEAWKLFAMQFGALVRAMKVIVRLCYEMPDPAPCIHAHDLPC